MASGFLSESGVTISSFLIRIRAIATGSVPSSAAAAGLSICRTKSRGMSKPPFDDPKWRVSLADGYPLLVVTQSSLDLLNAKLASPIGMERFRPNLVIAGATPHAEDSWTGLQIGSVQLAIVKPCARCSTVLVDPTTAKVGREPLRTLAEYRRMPRSVMFAQNALVVTPGQLRVGTAVEISNPKRDC